MNGMRQRGVLFSTEPFMPQSRFSAFREAAAETFSFLSFSTPTPETFKADLSINPIGRLVVFDIETNSLQAEASMRRAGREDDTLSFQFCLSGQAFITGGDDIKLKKGDLLIAPSVCNGRAYYHDAAKIRSLMIPRSRLEFAVDHHALASTYSRLHSSAGASLLEGWIESALRSDGAVTAEMSAHYERIAVDLLALMLGVKGDAKQQILEGGLRVARRAAVLEAIRSSALDPRLSASRVAENLGVSERYIHMLLEETGRTFSEHVLEQRLQHARGKLKDPSLAHLKISDIALGSGFVDISHFNRTFRRRFGERPSHVRFSSE